MFNFFKKKNKADEIRLKAKSLDHLKELIVEELSTHGVEISFDNWLQISNRIENTHSCPIGDKTNFYHPSKYLGATGHINGIISSEKNVSIHILDGKGWNDEFVLPYFRINGIHVGTGCPGSMDGKFSIGIYIFAADFPNIEEFHSGEKR